jgi:hypothetical protein
VDTLIKSAASQSTTAIHGLFALSFKLLAGGLLAAVFGVSIMPAQAQDTLELFSPVTGQIASGSEQRWTFSAPNGAVLSFHVEATSGSLDPAFRLSSGAGVEIIGNDDYDYPKSRDALLEAITMPRTDTYTVTVYGTGETSGEYRLTMTPGFSQVETSENFNGDLKWKATSEPLTVSADNGQLVLDLAGISQTGIAVDLKAKTTADYYAQVAVTISGEGGWSAGMTARQTDGDHYYLLQINEAGQWHFILHQPDNEQVLRDWTPHPAIVAGNGTFTLSMMVNDIGFDFFYNGQFFGHVSDATLTAKGQIGLSAATRATLSAQVKAHFDDLSVTVPIESKGHRIVPEQLVGGKPNDIAQELQRRSLIPAGGMMALTVDSSFVESQRPGVERVMLGRGSAFSNFAIGATISWTSSSAGVTGCGLIFRSADDTHYTLAYLDQTGGYGVSRRDGDSFTKGIFGVEKALKPTAHQLVVVARESQLLYYVDGQYEGTLDNPVTEGSVGGAVVNFEPISTSCQFTDTWLWDFPGTGL